MKIRHQQTGETIEVPKGMENQMKQHLSKGGDPMQLLGNKKKVKLNLKKHQQGGEQMQDPNQQQAQQQGGGDQQAQMQQLVQMAEQALSQGANPQQVAQMLMQKGVPQEVVQQVIQAAMQDLQQQGQQQQAPQEQMPQEQEMQQQPQMNYGGYMQNAGAVKPIKKQYPFNIPDYENFTLMGRGKDEYDRDVLNMLSPSHSYMVHPSAFDYVPTGGDFNGDEFSTYRYKEGNENDPLVGMTPMHRVGKDSMMMSSPSHSYTTTVPWGNKKTEKQNRPLGHPSEQKNGGYMQQGGLTDWWMQAGGQKKTTFADIEKMYQQIGKPAGASALTDYPPTYTYDAKPKIKILPKKVYTPQTYQELPPSPIIDYPPTYTQTKENGGYMAEGGKHWIQGAVNPAHKGYCTPMTKATCTPKRKAFAKTMKKHHGFHQEGGFVKGQQYEMDDSQIANLRAMGYKIKEV